MNEITGISIKTKSKINTIVEDKKKRKNISETYRNEKEDLFFLVDCMQ